MFINDINPVLAHIGPLEIRYYGLVYVLGFLLAYFVVRHAVKKGRLKLKEDDVDAYMLLLILGSMFMSRVFEVFIYNFQYYKSNLLEFFMIWHGGLAYQGGMLGAILVTMIFARKHKIHFYDIADILVLPSAITLFFGKIANYINSELYGTITNVPWCVVFRKVDSYCRHPVQIYEAISILVLIGVLIWAYTKHKDMKGKGQQFWIFILGYSLTRFIVTFFRDEPKYLGLNVGQWASLAIILLSIFFIYKANKGKSKSKNI